MFVSNRVIFLKMQKTGGTHIARILEHFERDVGKNIESIGKHDVLSEASNGRLTLISVRNPWDWYVSLWAYGCAGKGGLNHWLIERDRKVNGLRGMLQSALRGVARPQASSG